MRGWIAPTAHLAGIGWFFGLSIAIFGGLGYWLDGKTGLEPLFTLVGFGLGLAVALVGGYRMLIPFINRYGSDDDGETKN